MSVKRAIRIAGRALMVMVMAAAAWLLYREFRPYSLSEIRAQIAVMPPLRIGLCIGLTALNYMILVGYDLVAVRAIGSKLPTKKVVLAAFTGHVTAMNLGPLLGGTPVRIRLYTSWGMKAFEVARLLAMVVITFWLGMLALCGMVFLLVPLPTLSVLNLHSVSMNQLGAGALLVACAYLALTLFRSRPIQLFGRSMQVPATRVALLQMGIAAADLAVAAASLYVLMPGEGAYSFQQFLGVYLLAVLATTFTNVPGGLGVLELVIMTLAGGAMPQAMVAALLTFRMIYYILPLIVAASVLAWNEVRSARRKAKALAAQAAASEEVD